MILTLKQNNFMRVLYVHNDYGIWTGEEASAETIVKLLKEHSHDVFWFRKSSRKLWSNDSFFSKAAAFVSGIHNSHAAREIAIKLDKIKPDIVQVQNIYPFLSPSIFRPIRERKIPIVMRCPNYRLFCPTGLYFSKGSVCEKCTSAGREFWCIFKNCGVDFFKSTGYALRNAWARMTSSIQKGVDIFIVQTNFQKKKFVENGISSDRIEILPGMIHEIDISGNGHIGDSVCFVGRPSREKGIDTFIQAAKATPQVPFSVAGDCPTSGQYLSSTPDNMNWLGFLKGKALFNMYQSSRFIVVPSNWYEGFPNVIVSAMMTEKPVIASRLGGIPEIVDDGITGLLCEPNNPDDLSEKIQYLWDRPQLCKQMGRAGRHKASQEYSPEKCYERLMMIYQKAIEII